MSEANNQDQFYSAISSAKSEAELTRILKKYDRWEDHAGFHMAVTTKRARLARQQ